MTQCWGTNPPREFKSDEEETKFLAKIIVTNALAPIAKGVNRNRFININNQLHLTSCVRCLR
ncbi:MAG: hypothetical protein ACLT1C_03565 [Weissella confusa]